MNLYYGRKMREDCRTFETCERKIYALQYSIMALCKCESGMRYS